MLGLRRPTEWCNPSRERCKSCTAFKSTRCQQRKHGKEVFLNCVALQEIVIPTELRDVGNRAFCGCEKLQRFIPLDWGDLEQWVQAEHNAFFMCDKFEKPQWVEVLPADGLDSDAFDEELYHAYSEYHASPFKTTQGGYLRRG